jgi:hypothetical protein
MVALAAMAALTALPADATTRQERPAASTEATAPRDAGEPIMAIVSIKTQQVTFYDAEGWILRAPVSTGTTGRETPAGVFAVLEKDKDHHSSLYDDASMPHMQRITWNGIALHGGPLPGYAASHGCVRMPYGFAEKLFDKTRIGMRVIVSPNDAAPIDFSHPALFVPNPAAIAAAPARAEPLAREAAEATKAADEAKKAAVTAVRATASLAASLRRLEFLKKSADAQLVVADKALAAADQAKARAEDLKQKAAAKAAELATQFDTAKADAKPKLDAAAAATDAARDAARTDDAAKKAAATAAREAALLTASLRQLESLKSRADAELALADKALAGTDQARARAEDLRQKAAPRAAELATQLETAKADAKPKLDAAAAATDAAKAAAMANDEAKKAAAAAVREAALLTASLRKLESLKSSADAGLALADKALAAADQTKARTEDLKRKAAAKAAEVATQFDTAKADAKSKLDAAAAAKEAAKSAETRMAVAAKAADEAKLALEPVSVYISRATQKLYVRRNTHKRWPDGGEVFDASIEVPVTIRDPDKRIGTHVFTAVARDGAGLRWTAVTIDDGDGPKEALNRITIPQDLLDRIAPTVSPRSSIIVSDEPLSGETNYRTEFVAVLNDHPQGGFVTRRPTPNIRVASRNVPSDSGYGSFFQSGWGFPTGDPRPGDPRPGDPRRRGGQNYQHVQPGWQPLQPGW